MSDALDRLDADLLSERAEDLDTLFDAVEKGLPHCARHVEQVVYLDGGCGACAREKRNNNAKRPRTNSRAHR